MDLLQQTHPRVRRTFRQVSHDIRSVWPDEDKIGDHMRAWIAERKDKIPEKDFHKALYNAGLLMMRCPPGMVDDHLFLWCFQTLCANKGIL